MIQKSLKKIKTIEFYNEIESTYANSYDITYYVNNNNKNTNGIMISQTNQINKIKDNMKQECETVKQMKHSIATNKEPTHDNILT